MKVLWISPSPLLPTGLGKVSRYITEGLATLGYDVAVGNFQYAGEPIEIEGVKHYPLFKLSLLPLILNDFKPDVVIAYGSHWHPALSPISRIVAIERGYKLIWYVTVEFSFVSPIYLEPLVGSNYIATPSNFGKKVLSRHIPDDRIAVIPHGVNHKIFKPIRPKPKISGFEDKFVFGAVMRNTLRKEYPVILRAFASLPEDIKKHSILYFHTQPYEEVDGKPGWNLPILIKMFGLEDYVVFNPHASKWFGVSEEELARIYNAMDVHMLISTGEGFGLPVLESLACGVPNIVSNNTALPEVAGEATCYAECFEEDMVSSEGFGLYTTKISSVRECMIKLYEDPSLREKLAQKGIEQAKKFTWRKAVCMFADLIDRVVNEEKNTRIEREILKKVRVT